MPNNFPISTWIQLANISQVLSYKDNTKGMAINWGMEKGQDRVPFLLGFFADVVNWANTNIPTDTGLPDVATYMYSFCGRFILQATGVLAGVTGVVINPVTGTGGGRSAIAAWQVGFICGPGQPLQDGSTVLTIPYANVMVGSLLALLDNEVIFPYLLDRISYTVAYGSGTTVITFTQPALAGQAYLIQGLQSLS